VSRNPQRTRRILLLGAMLILSALAGVALFGRHRPTARPLAALETAENVSQRALNLDSTKTRKGLPSFRVRAKEGLTFREGNMELHDVEVTLFGPGDGRTQVLAPLALSSAGESGGWSFENGVDVKGESGLTLHVPQMRYRESVQEINSDGDVAFSRGAFHGSAVGLRYFVPRRRLEFLSRVDMAADPNGGAIRRITSDSATFDHGRSTARFKNYVLETATGEILSGTALDVDLDPNASTIREVRAISGFALATPEGMHGGSLLGPGGERLSGGSLTVDVGPEGEVTRSLAQGGVRLVVASQGGGDPSTLACERLAIAFSMGRPSTITAEEEARLTVPRTGAARDPGDSVLKGDIIEATLSPDDGAVLKGSARGHAEMTQGGRRSTAPFIAFDAPAEIWTLETDDPASVTRVEGPEGAITATRIEIRRREGTLVATGSVKSITQPARAGTQAPPGSGEGQGPAPSRAASSFLGGEGPVHGISESLTLLRDGRSARYRDRVRIWQGGSSLEAASIDLADDTGRVEARGSVVARAPARRSGGTGLEIITVSSSEMSFDRQGGEAKFTGNVRAQTEGARVESEDLIASAPGGGGIRELKAAGNVRFQQGSRRGDGDRLDVDLEKQTYVLSGQGRVVSIQDVSSQQVVKGVVLTYSGTADRILVESETGGRTWITLKPRATEGKKGGPESPH